MSILIKSEDKTKEYHIDPLSYIEVPEEEPVLQDKTITENGEYTADEGYDGLGTVTVEVGGSNEDWIIGDGNTHLWISLTEGKTSPWLGIGVNGTIAIDWGDGSTPDTQTGTHTANKYFIYHEYARAGDYIITLSGEGSVGFFGAWSGSLVLCRSRNSSGVNDDRPYRNSLTKLEMGENATIASTYAFYDCGALTNLKISSGASDIKERAFASCTGLTDVSISDGVTNIGQYAFYGDRVLTNINIPNSVTAIGAQAFEGCYGLININIPDGVRSIGKSAFSNCSRFTNIKIPNSVTSIGDSAFSSCSNLINANIPDNITSVPGSVFSGCECLVSISIPDGVTSIGQSAFFECYRLANIKIPKSVTSIGTYAFYACSGVSYYDFSQHTSVPTLLGTNAFNENPADCQIRVPAALVDEWKAATNWSTYADYIVGV